MVLRDDYLAAHSNGPAGVYAVRVMVLDEDLTALAFSASTSAEAHRLLLARKCKSSELDRKAQRSAPRKLLTEIKLVGMK